MHLHRFSIVLAFVLALAACKSDTASDDPRIEITFPEQGSLHTQDRLRIQGTADNLDQIEVNGVVAEVVGGEWEALVPLEQGEVTVVAAADGADDTVTFTIDSIPPVLTVAAPERGLYVEQASADSITVTGKVVDPGTGLEILQVGQQIIHPDVEGNFSWEVPLEEGLNEIFVSARDVAGNTSDDIRGVMYGNFVPADSVVEPGFDIWIDKTGVGVMEEVIEGFLTAENLMVMAAAFENDFVQIDNIELGSVDAALTLRADVIDSELVINDLVVEGAFILSGTSYSIRIEVRTMRILLGVTPYATADGLLDVAFTDPAIEIDPADLSYDIEDLSDEDNATLENLIIQSANAGFGYVLGLGFFSAIYDPDILDRKITVFDRTLHFLVEFDEVDVFSEGMLVRTRITMPGDSPPDVRQVPGALDRDPGPSSGYDPTGDIAFSVIENTVDRLLHGVFASGLLNYELDAAAFAGFDLPFQLTASELSTVIDSQISSVAGPNTPAGLRLRPMFPPVTDFDTTNHRLLIRLGEFQVDLMLYPAGQAPIVLATLSAFLDLSVRLSITEGIVVRLDFDTELRADVVDEPEIDLDDESFEAFLEQLIALIPQVLAAGLDLRGEADVTWMTLSDPVVWVHGADEDHGTINLKMTANPQTLEPFEPPEMP